MIIEVKKRKMQHKKTRWMYEEAENNCR